MTVRPARPGDRPAVAALQRRLPEPAPELLAPAAGGELLVSTVETGVVGYLLWFPGEPAYVAELAVAPEHRDEGRGTALFRALFERLPVGHAVTLRVAAENEGAIRLYRRLGFERTATLPAAYESGAGYRMRTVVDGEGSGDRAGADA